MITVAANHLLHHSESACSLFSLHSHSCVPYEVSVNKVIQMITPYATLNPLYTHYLLSQPLKTGHSYREVKISRVIQFSVPLHFSHNTLLWFDHSSLRIQSNVRTLTIYLILLFSFYPSLSILRFTFSSHHPSIFTSLSRRFSLAQGGDGLLKTIAYRPRFEGTSGHAETSQDLNCIAKR